MNLVKESTQRSLRSPRVSSLRAVPLLHAPPSIEEFRETTNFGRFVEHYDVALNKLIDAQLARLS